MNSNRPQRLFFISTNNTWGGSEVLWYQSAQRFIKEGYSVAGAVKYQHKNIETIKRQLKAFVEIDKQPKPFSLLKRIVNRFASVYRHRNSLDLALATFKPDLVVISVGNNISAAETAELCVAQGLQYIIVSQIVTDLNWYWLDDILRDRLVNAFENALKSYFVSQDNLLIHETLLAHSFTNAEIVYNPFIVPGKETIVYPEPVDGFDVAVIGRVECYHKGLDILLKVLADKKWQARNIRFNFYGNGPHTNILGSLLEKWNIKNVFLKGTASLHDIWNINHLLVMPSRMEGQSLALLEALYLGRTVVATNVGGAAEVIVDNVTGFIAPTYSQKDIDDALERAWEKRFDWELIGKAAGLKLRELMPPDPVAFFNNKLKRIIPGGTLQPV